MVLDPIPQSLPVHFFGSRPQPPTSLCKVSFQVCSREFATVRFSHRSGSFFLVCVRISLAAKLISQGPCQGLFSSMIAGIRDRSVQISQALCIRLFSRVYIFIICLLQVSARICRSLLSIIFECLHSQHVLTIDIFVCRQVPLVYDSLFACLHCHCLSITGLFPQKSD